MTATSRSRGPPLRSAANLDVLLDEAYENLPLSEVLDAPVGAPQGVSAGDAEELKAAFDIKTVRDLGTNKYFRAAVTVLDLEAAARQSSTIR